MYILICIIYLYILYIYLYILYIFIYIYIIYLFIYTIYIYIYICYIFNMYNTYISTCMYINFNLNLNDIVNVEVHIWQFEVV